MTFTVPEVVVGLLDRAGVGVAVLDGELRYRYVNERLAAINDLPAAEHRGRTVVEVLDPGLGDRVAGFVREVLETGRARLATQEHAGPRAGRPSALDVSYMPLEVEGERLVGVILLDVTERQRAMSAAERRLRQQAALADLAQLALRETDLDVLLTATTKMLATELGAERSGVLQIAPERDHLRMVAGTGFPPGAMERMTAAIGPGSQAGFTLATNTAIVSDDTLLETRFRYTKGLLDLGVRSGISVPIPGEKEPYGVLGVLASRPGHFDEDDASVVRAAANVLGAAVVRLAQSAELAELAEQRGRLVAQALDAGDRERRQVADVLHDEVLQHLLFARLELGLLEGESDAKDRVLGSIETATSTLRGVVGGLHPVTLSHAGLTAAIEGLAAEHAARSGVKIEADVDSAAEGPADRLVFSIVRELLTNVLKHAGATAASVRVGERDGLVSIEVADDGAGMPEHALETAIAGGNVGLANIRERVMALGGSLATRDGIDGRGTCVSVTVPGVGAPAH